MAAFRRIIQRNGPTLFSPSLVPPALCVSFRGIVSKLFVGGLSVYTTDDRLCEAFSRYGQVVEATVVMDRVTNKSKSFGFVTFASVDEAHDALSDMNGKELHGRIIYVDYAKPKTTFREDILIARGPPVPPANT